MSAERNPQRLGEQRRNQYGSTIDIVRYPWDRESSVSRQLVFHLVRGKEPGFTLGINAGTHGDEGTSILAAYRIFNFAASHLRSGTLVGLPIANWEAVKKKERGTPDLNRAYDFDEVTTPLSQTQRHAKAVAGRFLGAFYANGSCSKLSQLAHPNPYPGLIIDFHTEDLNTAGNVVPYIRLDPTLDNEVLGFMIFCAEILEIPWAMESEHYLSDGLDKSLTGYLVKQKVPSLTIELGPGGGVDDRYVGAAKVMMEKLMAHFGMIELKPDRFEGGMVSQFHERIAKAVNSTKQNGPLQLVDGYSKDASGKDSMARGSLRLKITPGQIVNKGEVIGYIMDYTKWPATKTPIHADRDQCLILSVPGSEVLEYQPGDLAYQAAVPISDERIKKIHDQQKNLLKLTTSQES